MHSSNYGGDERNCDMTMGSKDHTQKTNSTPSEPALMPDVRRNSFSNFNSCQILAME